jgi:hypothetical protein
VPSFQKQLIEALCANDEIINLIRDRIGAVPFGVSIADAAKATSESKWMVEDKLRRGIYRARKSGRRTIVEFASIREHWASLPPAKFLPAPSPSKRRTEQVTAYSE